MFEKKKQINPTIDLYIYFSIVALRLKIKIINANIKRFDLLKKKKNAVERTIYYEILNNIDVYQ